MSVFRRSIVPLLAALATVTSAPAWSQATWSVAPSAQSPSEEVTMLSAARPRQRSLAKPPAESLSGATDAEAGAAAEPSVRVGAAGSGEDADGSGETLPAAASPQSRAVGAENYGRNNRNTVYQFSDLKVPDEIVGDFPYRAAGYFYFKASDDLWYWCTASLISNSIMVTAGHCVHDGGNKAKGWIKKGYFYPARKGNKSPYGRAAIRQLYTTEGWYKTGALDKGYDIGVAVLAKRENKGKEIGKYTGYLGFCYKDCLLKYWSLTALGYPHNYYNGTEMSSSQHLGKSDSRDYTFGSGMQGGSSGGPQVANIGELKNTAAAEGGYTKRNVVFAVTSWGYTDQDLMIQGGSSLSGPKNNNDFKGIFNKACNKARDYYGSKSCTPL